MDRIPCIYGHDVTKYNRSDRRCGQCHVERNRRYRKTQQGKILETAREERRRRNPERWYYKLKWYLTKKIESSKQKIAELEGIYSE